MQYTKSYEKNTDIQSMDISLDWDEVISPKAPLPDTHAESAGDGLLLSLQAYGCVDIEYISSVTGMEMKDVIERLKGSIFQDPEEFDGCYYKGFKTSEDYLSGNLLQKLRKAQEMNAKYNGRFTDNIDTLIKVLPAGVSADEIFFTLSSPWIPEEIVEGFIHYILRLHPTHAKFIKHDPITDMWQIPSNISSYSVNISYGTTRMTAAKLLQSILNMAPLAVYDYHKIDAKHKKRVLNKPESLLLEEKANKIQDAFRYYVKKNPEVHDKMTNYYNELYGYNVARVFNGSFLELKDANPNVTLYDYQKNAIARVLLTRNTFLAHSTGAGKTYEMIAGGEELLRTGKSDKNLYVIPNNIVGEWNLAYKYLYPNSNPLVLETKHFTKAKRRATLEKIRDGGYTTVIIPYSSFDKIPMSHRNHIASLVKRIQEIDDLFAESSKNRTYALEGVREKLCDELESVRAEGPSIDEDISLDYLGFTRLFLDEAHNYKNLPLSTAMGSIKGINIEGSKKCAHMLEYVDYLNSLPNGGVIMGSGTPITNSITDAYVIQRYLQHGELKLMDIVTFDNWAAMFAENHEDYEVDLDAQGYRATKRFSRFHNLPELTQILSEVTDFHYSNDSQDLPQFNGYTDTVITKSKELKKYLKEISDRIDKIRNGLVSMKDDNLLKITNDGRKAALDLRLVDYQEYQYLRNGKVFSCAENVLNDYLKTRDTKGVQLVFSDISTPKDSFNVYDELKSILVRFGIPEAEIAYVHDATTDAARSKMFEAARRGEIRILIGSTAKLGTGVNVQDLLYSIHHLSIPWRPADMVQREGRIIRQGNTNPEVFIHRYIAEGSFDAYSWQLLELKQKFINELLSNSITERSKEDIQDTVLSYSEVKALAIGNPLLKEHVELKNQFTRLKMLQKRSEARFALLSREQIELPAKIKEAKLKADNLKKDAKLYASAKKEIERDEKMSIRHTIFDSLMDYLNQETEKPLMVYQGFEFILPANLIANSLYLKMKGNGIYSIAIGNSDIGALQRVDNYLDSLERKAQEAAIYCEDLKARAEAIEEEFLKRPDYTEAIESLSKKLQKIEKRLGIVEH